MSAVKLKILEWTPECAVNVPQIDQEHRIWFGAVNRLHEAMLDGKGKEHLRRVFAKMMQFTLDHFAHEEELMAAERYPGLQAHIQEHDELRSKARAFGERFERGETTMTIELMLCLSVSIKKQIMTTDRLLGEYLSARKCAPGAR